MSWQLAKQNLTTPSLGRSFKFQIIDFIVKSKSKSKSKNIWNYMSANKIMEGQSTARESGFLKALDKYHTKHHAVIEMYTHVHIAVPK